MNVLYIGGGFVGACSAGVSADSGHQTLVFDVDKNKVAKLGSNNRETIEQCLFEEGLGDLLVRNRERITFTTDYQAVHAFLNDCDAVFLCVPTPEVGETGETDLTYYRAAAEELAKALAGRNNGAQTKYVAVVNKSTVPIELIEETAAILNKHGVKNCDTVSNPEFLVEGKAVQGSLRPDRVVVGAESEQAFGVMRRLYERFYNSSTVKYLETKPKEAAAGKLLANFYLFNKLAVCFDVIGRTAEAFPGISFEEVRKILMTDPRIGSWGLYDSLYAGGSCFIKDARSLSYQLQTAGHNAVLVNETYLANKRQLELFLSRAEKDAGFNWSGKRVALLGLAFKQGTNDVRNSPSLEIMHFLGERQVGEVVAHDPAAADYFTDAGKRAHGWPAFRCVKTAVEAIEGADILVVATDWPEFRSVADVLLSPAFLARPVLMDGRRMFQHRYGDLTAAGFTVIAVGSPTVVASS